MKCKCIKQPKGSYVTLDHESRRNYGVVSKNYFVRDTDEIIKLTKIEAKMLAEFHNMDKKICKLRSIIQRIRVKKAKRIAKANGIDNPRVNCW